MFLLFLFKLRAFVVVKNARKDLPIDGAFIESSK